MLFSRKKRNHHAMKILTEKEIQDRLYGKYRAHSDTTSLPAVQDLKVAQVQEPKAPQSVSPSADLFIVRPAEPRRDVAAPPIAAKTPDEAVLKPVDGERREQIGKWIKEENKLPGDAVPKWKVDERAAAKKPVMAQPRSSRTPGVAWGAMTGSLARFFGAVGGIVTALLRGVWALLWRVLTVIDLTQPRVKQGLYWISIAGLLAFIFFGIHALNANREVAMKSPAKQVRAPVRHAAVVPKTEEPKAVPAVQTVVVPQEVREEPAPVRETAPAAAPETRTGFGVQVATYVNEDDAQSALGRFQKAGFEAFVKSTRRSEGKRFYSVYLGPFESYRKAQTELAKFKKNEVSKPFQDAFVRSI
jgi:cell division septation protein DedD